MKRIFDISIVVIALPAWLFALGLCMVLILLVDGRPVFFRQRRAGLRGVPFTIWKLRTMKEGEGGDDERLTKLGRFLRASSLDELPQLFQVLTGRMSLVGPRPLPVRYLERYSARQARRHAVRPGITGWAQVNGRNAISWEQKFEYDIWYVDNRSFFLDLKIIALTFAKVLRRSGINNREGETMGEFTGSK